MMVETAGGIAVPRWAQVRLWIPHSLSLSGPWRPALKREVPEVCLLSADGRTILTPLPNDIDTRFSGLQQPSITVGERRFLQGLGQALRASLDVAAMPVGGAR
jgi:hypothetical protein